VIYDILVSYCLNMYRYWIS